MLLSLSREPQTTIYKSGRAEQKLLKMVSFPPTSFPSTTVESALRLLSKATACASLLNESTILNRRDGLDCSFIVSTQLPHRNHMFYSTVYQACSLPVPANIVQNLNSEQSSSSSAATVSPRGSRVWIVAPIIIGLVLFVFCGWMYCLRPYLQAGRPQQIARKRNLRSQQQFDTAASDRVLNERHVDHRRTSRVYDYRRQEWTSVRIGDARDNHNGDRDLPAQGPRRTLQANNPATPEQRIQPPLNHGRLNEHFQADPPPIYPQPPHPLPIHPPLVHSRPARSPITRTSPNHQSPVLHRSISPSPAQGSSTQRRPGQVPQAHRFAHGPPNYQPPIQQQPNYPPLVIPPQVYSSPTHPPLVHLPPPPRAPSTPSSAQRSAWNDIRAERRRVELHRPSIASLAVERPVTPEVPTNSSDFSADTLISSRASVPKVNRTWTRVEQMEVDDTMNSNEEHIGNEHRRDAIQWILETLGIFQMGRLIWRPGRR